MITHFIVTGETQVTIRATSDIAGAVPPTLQAVLITSDRDPDDLPELEMPTRAWVDLFDGQTLDGWVQVQGTASYQVGTA